MSQTLYRKWRPQQWEQIIGQDHIVQTLRNAVTGDRVAHAYLFAGPRGTGKTSTARILAKAVNCLENDLTLRPCDQCEHCRAINQGRYLDLIEIDAASNTSVDDVRDLREKINFSPNHGPFKVYIVDEVHMLSTAAFNALLKTLEEPPAHAIFILATTEVHKIPATVLSRCQRHEFRRIPVGLLVEQLNRIAKVEKLKVDEEAMYMIARQATGSVRDAISLLDQLASASDHITLVLAQEVLGTVSVQSVIDLVEAIIQNDPAAGLNIIHRTIDSGSDPRLFSRQIVDYLRNTILSKMGNIDHIDTTAEIKAQIKTHAQVFSLQRLLSMLNIFNQSASEIRSAWQPSLPLEMALIEVLHQREENKELIGSPLKEARVEKYQSGDINQKSIDTPVVAQSEVQQPLSTSSQDQNTGLTLKQVTDIWKKCLLLVGQQSKQTQSLLNSCKPFGVKGSIVYLGFNGDFAKSKMERKENLDMTQEILTSVLNRRIEIRCFVVSSKKMGLPPDVDNDGMVAAALRDLGGEIVDVQ